jgi:hypothetical protein
MKSGCWVVTLSLLAFSGCTGFTERYNNADATVQQLQADRDQCLTEAQQVFSSMSNVYGGSINGRVVADCRVYRSCLAGRGYVADPHGALAVSSGPAIECRKD